MRLEDIQVILENRLRSLQETRAIAVTCGSILQVLTIDEDISTTIVSLEQIKSILNG